MKVNILAMRARWRKIIEGRECYMRRREHRHTEKLQNHNLQYFF
jgi:hypothetical protein